MSNTVIKIENLSKGYRLGLVGTGTLKEDIKGWWYRVRGIEDPTLMMGEENKLDSQSGNYVWALKDINLEVKQGEVLGIIGKNGAGKSTLLKLLSRVTGPTTGTIKTKGRIASLLEVGTGMHPELTGRENIFLNGAILGMTKAEIKRKFDEIVNFAGVARYIDTPVKRYSSGMNVRLGFAVAAFLEPEILIVDEVLAVGDAEFQRKAVGKMQDVSKGEGRTVLFVSHNMKSVEELCNKGIVLSNGSKIFEGNKHEAIDRYISANKTIINQTNVSKRLDRKGTGEIRLTYFKIVDQKGNEKDYVQTGETFSLKLGYKVFDKTATYINNLNVSVSLKDGKNNLIFNNHSFMYQKLFKISDFQQEGEFLLEIRELPVFSGEYVINFSLVQGYTYIDGFENGFRFEIRNGKYVGKELINRPEDGKIIVNAEWHLV